MPDKPISHGRMLPGGPKPPAKVLSPVEVEGSDKLSPLGWFLIAAYALLQLYFMSQGAFPTT